MTFSYILSEYQIYSKILNVYNIYRKYHACQTNKQNITMKTYTEIFGTCINPKKTEDTYTVCTKSPSKDSLRKLFRHIWLFSMSRKSFLTCLVPRSSHTNVQELI